MATPLATASPAPCTTDIATGRRTWHASLDAVAPGVTRDRQGPRRTRRALRASAAEAAHSADDAATPEARLVEALPVVDRVVRALGRRYRLTRDECDEFLGFVRLRLIEDDYAVLRRFEGRSRLSTYLRTVIRRLFLDARVKAWGRWRPSAEAVRLGPTAIALERLLERQHLPLEQAIETLRAADPGAREHDLHAIAVRLPRRPARHFVDDSLLVQLPAPGPGPDSEAEQRAAGRLRGQVSEALRSAAAALSPRTRLLLRLRFVDGTSVADVSRTLGCEQKPLYREIDRALAQLRRGLEARGISSSHVRALMAAAGQQMDGATVQ